MNRSLYMAIGLSVWGVFAQLQGSAQCPEVLDISGLVTPNPAWVSCYAESPQIDINPASDWDGFIVNWGDGSAAETVNWVAGDASLSHIYPDGASAYSVSITDPVSGCTVAGSFEVIPPVANLTSASSQVCEGSSVNFLQNGTGGSQNYWNFGLGSTFIPTSNGVVSYNFTTPGYHTVTNIFVSEIDPIGCRDTSTVEIFVKTKPEMEVNISQLESCGPTFISGGASGSQLSNVVWSFAVSPYFAAGMEMPLTYFSNTGSNPISVTGIGTNGCNVSVTQSVHIYQEATATINSATTSACEGELTQFSGVAFTSIEQAITNVTWDFGDGTLASGLEAEHTYSTAGTYEVDFIVETDICTKTVTETVVIEANPVIGLDASVLSGCSPLDVEFNSTVEGAASYVLDLGEGGLTTDLNAMHTYSPANHNITLSAQSAAGCSSQATIQIESLPAASISLVNTPAATCGIIDVPLESITAGAASLEWSATNGWNSTESIPQFTLTNGTSFPVNETVSVTALADNGCHASAQFDVEVLPVPAYDFELTTDSVCAPLVVNLPTMEDAITSTWDFGDGETSLDDAPFHIWGNPTTALASYDVTFEGINAFGCAGIATRTVHVKPQPMAAFSLSAVQGCDPLELVFFNQSSLGTSYELSTTAGQEVTLVAGEQVNLAFPGAMDVTQFELELTANHALGCSDVKTETVEVLPNPVFEIAASIEASCTPYNLEFPAIENAVTSSWNFGDGSSDSNLATEHTFENFTNELVTFTVSMNGTNTYGCSGTATIDVPVKPMPSADFTLDLNEGCAPLGVSVTNTSSEGATYNFTTDSGEAWSVEPSDSQTIVFNGGSDVVQQLVELTVVHPLGCTDSRSEMLTVFPEAQFDFELGVDSACSPMVVNLPAIEGAESLTWIFGDGTTAAAGTASHTFSNATSELASYAVTVAGENVHGCADQHEAMVHVKPQPEANFSLDNASGCSPLQVNATNASSSATTYTFSTDAGIAYGVSSNGMQSFTFGGGIEPEDRIITMTAVHELGCSDAHSESVQVLPATDFSFALEADSACSPFEMVTPFIDGASSVAWRFDDGSNITDPFTSISWTNESMDLETHTIELEAFNAYGCSNIHTDEVHIKPQPVADFAMSDAEGCAPFPLVLTNNSTQADGFHWDYDDEHELNTTMSGSHTYIVEGEEAAVVRSIKLTATHSLGCSAEKTEEFEVFPEAVAAAIGTLEGCTPFDANIAYEGAPLNQITWSLNGSPAGEGEAFATTLVDAGVSALAMVVATSHGCQDSLLLPLTAWATPQVELSVDEASACAGSPVELTHVVNGADNVTYAFSNGGSLAQPDAESETVYFENPYANPATVVITQTATTLEGCVAVAEVSHTVYPDAEAHFGAPTSGCSPVNGLLVNLSNDADQFEWIVEGATLTDVSPVYSFINLDSADLDIPVTLIAQNGFGCADTTTQTITVFGTPEANVSVLELTGCYPIEATFQAAGGVSTTWAHGNDEPIAEPGMDHTHVFFNPYDQPLDVVTEVEVANAHGCTATTSVTVTVNPELTAQFDVVEAGCTPLELVLVNQSSGASGFVWNFGDGTSSIASDPLHTLVNDGPTDQTFVVELVAASGYGCTDTMSVGVVVHPEPVAEFFATPMEQTFPNASVAFTNLSQSGEGAVHTWSFGDGGSTNDFNPGVHNYGTWGSFDVTLDVDNGFCDHALTQTVIIHAPAPVAEFTGEAEGCAPVHVAFTNESEFAAEVLWDFGDGATSSDINPVHQYDLPGVYDVKLRVTGHQGLVQEIIHESVVVVLPSPIALFQFTPYEVIAPGGEVTFVDQSSEDAIEYLWNFGDGATSFDQHPRHSYEEAGLYTVSLAVRNDFGCTDTHTYIDAIWAKPGGFMEFPTAFTPNLEGPQGGSYNLSDLDNDVFHPNHAGIEEFEMSVFNIWGEMIFRSSDPMVGWDGYVNGLLAPQNTYAWKATARFSDGRRLTQSGDLTLIIN